MLGENLGILGIPYCPGGRDPETGLDCWGLAMYLFREHGVELPDLSDYRNAPAISDHMDRVDAPYPVGVPLLVAMRLEGGPVDHVGTCLDGERVIHTTIGSGVHIQKMTARTVRVFLEGVYKWRM